MAITLGTDGYCTLSNVQSRLRQQTFNTTSRSTAAEVETEGVTQNFHLMNGYIDTIGYTVPVVVGTYPVAGAILKQINTDLAAAYAIRAMYAADNGGDPEQAEIWEERAMAKLEAISKGKLSLVDAPKQSDAVTLVNERDPVASFNKDENGVERCPVFTRTRKW